MRIFPIFQPSAVVRTLVSLVLCALLLCGGTGCNTEPFEVVAPAFRSNEGTALVSVRVPSFSRGLIQRVRLRVTSADTSPLRPIERDMNFPIPGGNLAVAQVTGIPAGRRQFTAMAFDTEGALRFRGEADSTIADARTHLVQVGLQRIGGTVNFKAVINFKEIKSTEIDSATLALLPLTSVLDILELIPYPYHPQLAMLPLASVGLGSQFSLVNGAFSRQVTVAQIPTGNRLFVAHLKDLSSNGTRAFADTIVVQVDTLGPREAVFKLEPVKGNAGLLGVFLKTTLPPDSTVVVITPQF